MSSSPRPAELPAAFPENPPGKQFEKIATPYLYPEISPIAGGAEAEPGEPGQSAHETAERERRARALGREEGKSEARKILEEHLAKERAAVAAALKQFAGERSAYYQKVETEVVQLALSIARQILHREAEMDPLLLAGMVRVALDKIEGATKVKLRTHPQNAADWQRFLSLRLQPGELPEIVEDSAVAPDRCVLETSLGIAELGMDVQLKEIERGMMDLLGARPEGAE